MRGRQSIRPLRVARRTGFSPGFGFSGGLQIALVHCSLSAFACSYWSCGERGDTM